MSVTNSKLDLLFNEVKDKHAQENFYRLKLFIDNLVAGNITIVQAPVLNTGIAVWEEFTRTAAASTTTIIDTLPLVGFRQLEYIVNFRDSVTNREKGLKMTVLKDDTTLEDQVYAITGAPLALGISANINGSNMELVVDNSIANTVDVSFARLTLP